MEKRPNHRPPKERIIETELTKEFYSSKEVAELMQLSEGTIRRMIRIEELPAEKMGLQWIIKKTDLEKFTAK